MNILYADGHAGSIANNGGSYGSSQWQTLGESLFWHPNGTW